MIVETKVFCPKCKYATLDNFCSMNNTYRTDYMSGERQQILRYRSNNANGECPDYQQRKSNDVPLLLGIVGATVLTVVIQITRHIGYGVIPVWLITFAVLYVGTRLMDKESS